MSKIYNVSELGDMLIYQNEKGDTKVDAYFCENNFTEYYYAYKKHL